MMNKLLIATTLLTSTVLGHMKMENPPPRKGANNPSYPYGIDYDLVAPLGADKPFPCGGAQAGPSVLTVKAGGSISVDITGGASHNGGHCQFAISYDGCSTWVVLKDVMNDCLTGSGLHFDIPIPSTAPSSDKAVFSWNWINKTGNREFYMNCADITVDGVSGGSITGPALLIADLPGYPTIPEFTNGGYDGQDLFDARKTITVTASGSSVSSGNSTSGSQSGNSSTSGSNTGSSSGNQSGSSNSGVYTTISNSGTGSGSGAQSGSSNSGSYATSGFGNGSGSGAYPTSAAAVTTTSNPGYATGAANLPSSSASGGYQTAQPYKLVQDNSNGYATAASPTTVNGNHGKKSGGFGHKSKGSGSNGYPTTISPAQPTTNAYPVASSMDDCDDEDYPTSSNPPIATAAPAYPVVNPVTTTTNSYPVTVPTTQAYPVVNPTTTNAYPVSAPTTTNTQAYPVVSPVTTTTTTNAYPVIASTTQAYPVVNPTTTDDYPVIAPTTTIPANAYPVAPAPAYPTQAIGY